MSDTLDRHSPHTPGVAPLPEAGTSIGPQLPADTPPPTPASPEPPPAAGREDGSPAPRVLLTVEAAAEQLSIGRTTMYGLIKAGQISTVRVGRLRRVPADALHAYTTRLLAAQLAERGAA